MLSKKTIWKITWSALTSVGLYFYFWGLSSLGTHYRETHRLHTPPKFKTEYNQGWKFRTGDDNSFAKPDLNDSSWETVTCDSLPESYHGEIAWFRLHLKADPVYLKERAVLLFDHYGASDIFFDGHPIASFGTVADNKEKQVDYDPGNSPLNVDLQDRDSHLIAVRFSNPNYRDYEVLSEKTYAGFVFALGEYQQVQKSLEASRNAEMVGFCVATFLLTLSFIHFLLFLFYRSARENLYYSLFVLSFSLIFFSLLLMVYVPVPQSQLLFRKLFLVSLNPLVFLTLSLFVFSLGDGRLPRSFWIAVVVGLTGLIHVLTGWLGIGFYLFSVMWMAIYCVISMTIGTYVAIREKRPGYRILAAGVGTFALFIFVCISIIFYSNSLSFSFESAGDIFFILLVLSLLSIPISMSVYLAYTSSRTNRDLKQKLREVENLSAKNLEQEKEKQRILETQKETLEIQVRERTHEIEEQKKVIEEKNKDITDSINYAKHIQNAILTEKEVKYKLFADAFVLFKPKDIVSGDFYWFAEKNGKRLIAACDCTGHGVPGALMSMIGNNVLNQLVLERGITSPDEILDQLQVEIRRTLKQGTQSTNRDGMDVALLSFTDDLHADYAGAQRPLWIIRNGALEEIKATKQSIGGGGDAAATRFAKHELTLQKGDCIYIFSDGFADQFNRDSKKLMTKRFKEILVEVHQRPMAEQENYLDDFIERWKGGLEQTDDILVIGIRI